MKLAFSALGLAAGLLLVAPASVVALSGPAKKTLAPKAAETYKVDPKASRIEWLGTKVTGKHNGTVALQSGTVLLTNGQLTGGEVVIDMNSIADEDIKDEGYRAKLVGHLKSDDFFGVEKFPTATLKITKVEAIKGAAAGKPNYNVTADLTIKDKTNPVSFPATITTAGTTAKAMGTVTVDRAKYDVRYGSNSFFDNLGDKAISNDMVITFNVVANK